MSRELTPYEERQRWQNILAGVGFIILLVFIITMVILSVRHNAELVEECVQVFPTLTREQCIFWSRMR